jgi:hypothetical protein
MDFIFEVLLQGLFVFQVSITIAAVEVAGVKGRAEVSA